MRNSPNSIGNANAIVTSIVINPNQTVGFYNGSEMLRSFRSVRNIALSKDRQYIVITENDESIFYFSIWRLTSTGSISYTLIDKFSPTAQTEYDARINEVFIWCSVRAFKNCCDCSAGSTTGGQFIYEYNSATSTGDFYFVSGILLMSLTADDGQDVTGILENLPNGSWITFIGSSNPDNFVTFEISSYYVASGIAIFSATVIAGDSSAFADTDLFATYFDKAGTGGGGGGVETVTGTAVDNTDPLNPVIDYTPWNDLTGVPEDNEDLVNRVQNSEWIYGATTGTNTYAVNFAPALTALQVGQMFGVLFVNGNTGASTLNPNSLGAVPLVKGVSTALASGDIPAGSFLVVKYDGTSFQVSLNYVGLPTWQQVLIAGSTLTQNNVIDCGTHRVVFNNADRFQANVNSGGFVQFISNGTTVIYRQDDNDFQYLGAPINSALATPIAAATTTDMNVDGNYVHITGSGVSITSFGNVAEGAFRLVTFDASNTLTHNASSFILPTGANIVTEAGDSAIFVSESGSSNWKCLAYQRASGNPLNYEENIDWISGSAVTGYSALTVNECYYTRVGKLVTVTYNFLGTSNATTVTFTIPYAAYKDQFYLTSLVTNNGTASVNPGRLSLTAGSTTVTATRDRLGTAWTNSGQKYITGVFTYLMQ